MEPLYLDYNATTPLHPEVARVLAESAVHFGNPASAHSFGQEAERIANDSRETIASFLQCQPEELIFTSGGTESNTTVLYQLLAEMLRGKETRNLICSEIEHSSILEYSEFLKKVGISVTYIPVDSQGFLSLDHLEAAITPQSLVSIIAANNEIGTIQDLPAIAEIVHRAKAELHIDATQAVGKIPLRLSELPVHYLTAAAHKIYGPRGIGLLYRRPFTRFHPLFLGGGQQEEQRAGTENHILMAGFAEAIRQRSLEMDEERKRLQHLKTYCVAEIREALPFVQFNGPLDDTALSGTMNMSFPGVENEMLLLYLDMAGIGISTGSACASRTFTASKVLRSIGRSELEAFQTVRVSMGRSTTQQDIDRFISELITIVNRVKKE